MGIPVTFSSREFNQQLHKAKQASKKGPVIVTDRGRPAHVLLSYEEYERIKRGPEKKKTLIDLLALDDRSTDDFEFPTHRDLPRPADLSD